MSLVVLAFSGNTLSTEIVSDPFDGNINSLRER